MVPLASAASHKQTLNGEGAEFRILVANFPSFFVLG
jgi:hypothetical protein